ncbi:MAG: hypothetical protein KJ831_12940, partial [Candidatus Eisenbacteria bacterium]|nr:hypothetical protein [Candidatus Eisenbacteria bacterium]
MLPDRDFRLGSGERYVWGDRSEGIIVQGRRHHGPDEWGFAGGTGQERLSEQSFQYFRDRLSFWWLLH